MTLFLFFLLTAPIVEDLPSTPYSGLSLEQALERLQQQGLNIIYSSRLVKPEMKVLSEPKAKSLKEILTELLAQHRLQAREGPDGSLLIVKMPKKSSGLYLRGRVLRYPDKTPLPETLIQVVDHKNIARSDDAGYFYMNLKEKGQYQLKFSKDGYIDEVRDLELTGTMAPQLEVELIAIPEMLELIVVTPGAITLLDQGPEPMPVLSAEEIDRLPRLADDLYRALNRLPGTAGGDISAQINIRGGEQTEAKVYLDGLEIIEPFHLKDLMSLFSVFDSKAIGHVNYLPGGFPANYGNSLSGIIDLSTKSSEEHWNTEVGMSFYNVRLLSDDTFASGRGQWLVSLRKGYLDLVRAYDRPEAIGRDEESFNFSDANMKLNFKFNASFEMSVHFLEIEDLIRFSDEGSSFVSSRLDDIRDVDLDYEDYYLWFDATNIWSDRLTTKTIISRGRVDRKRSGSQEEPELSKYAVTDHRILEFIGGQQDWKWHHSEKYFLQWGYAFKNLEMVYDYESQLFETSPLRTNGGPAVEAEAQYSLAPTGDSYEAYISHRFRPWQPMTLEFGLRWHHQTYIKEDRNQLSPRFNLNFRPLEDTTIRAAWGIFHQTQGIHELQLEDGVSEFYQAQRAEHRILGLEQNFANGYTFKLDIYDKRIENPRVRFENQFNPVALFPEAEPDRIRVAPDRAVSQGVELFLKDDHQRMLTWWAGYAFGEANDIFDGKEVPRSWDQRHAFQFGLNLQTQRGWSFNLAGNYHSGWPTTALATETIMDEAGQAMAVPIYGPRNEERLSSFRRLDLRVTHRSRYRGGVLTCFMEILNVLNHKNQCCTDYSFSVDANNQAHLHADPSSWLSLIPSLGITYKF